MHIFNYAHSRWYVWSEHINHNTQTHTHNAYMRAVDMHGGLVKIDPWIELALIDNHVSIAYTSLYIWAGSLQRAHGLFCSAGTTVCKESLCLRKAPDSGAGAVAGDIARSKKTNPATCIKSLEIPAQSGGRWRLVHFICTQNYVRWACMSFRARGGTLCPG